MIPSFEVEPDRNRTKGTEGSQNGEVPLRNIATMGSREPRNGRILKWRSSFMGTSRLIYVYTYYQGRIRYTRTQVSMKDVVVLHNNFGLPVDCLFRRQCTHILAS